MLNHYNFLLEKMELPEDAEKTLRAAGESLSALLNPVIEKFYLSEFSFKAIADDLQKLSEASGINRFTVSFVFIATASERMLNDYGKAGIPEEIFWDTIMDLKYKLFECKTVKGVWGNFVEFWYSIFFSLNIFKLGRLEFERTTYDKEEPYTQNEITVKKGDTVYSVHIPSCGSLAKELRLDSYKKAYSFFAKERGDKPLVCICHSWLLFDKNREIFPPKINLIDFMNDWDIIMSEESDDFSDAWRVFGKDFDGDVSKLPQETSQQKTLVKWLGQGKKTGEGFGVLVFDGKIISCASTLG